VTVERDRTLALASDPAAEPAIACTLGESDLDGRMAEWRAVAARATARAPIEGGIRLAFDEIDARVLTDLAVREHECCAFLSFAVGIGTGGTTLEITGPAVVRDLIDALA
jgi:hypothetical protein